MFEDCVIVGAGIAGVSTAAALRDEGYDGRLTVLGAEPDPPYPYDRPALSKDVLLAEEPPAARPMHPDGFYAERDIRLRLGSAATRIRPDSRSVLLADGESVPADRVVVATGGAARRLDVPGADLPGVRTLRDLQDALAVRDYLHRQAEVVIVGGGFIGMEVAAAAAQRGCRVTVVETEELPMLRALGPEVAQSLTDAHRERGVRVLARSGVRGFEGGERVTGVRLADGTLLAAELVLVGVGMRAECTLAERSGLTVGGGVRADASGRTSHPAVYAAGDAAETALPDGGWTRVEHWQHARDAGAAVARAMLGRPEVAPPVPWFWSDQGEVNLQLAGRPGPEDERTWRGDPDARAFSVLYHRAGRITGVAAVNRGKDVRPAMELIRGHVHLDPDVLADPAANLKKVLKAAA